MPELIFKDGWQESASRTKGAKSTIHIINGINIGVADKLEGQVYGLLRDYGSGKDCPGIIIGHRVPPLRVVPAITTVDIPDKFPAECVVP
jgi:hypothetical protein